MDWGRRDVKHDDDARERTEVEASSVMAEHHWPSSPSINKVPLAGYGYQVCSEALGSMRMTTAMRETGKGLTRSTPLIIGRINSMLTAVKEEAGPIGMKDDK